MNDGGLPGVLRAQRLEVLDDSGRIRMVVGGLGRSEPGGELVGLEVRDANERPRITVAVSDDGAWMLVDLEGNARVHFGVNDPGSDAVGARTFFYVCGEEGAPVAGWRVDEGGEAHPIG